MAKIPYTEELRNNKFLKKIATTRKLRIRMTVGISGMYYEKRRPREFITYKTYGRNSKLPYFMSLSEWMAE